MSVCVQHTASLRSCPSLTLCLPLALQTRSFRPPNALELRENGEIVVEFDQGENTTVKLKGGPTSGPEAAGFTFDRVFPMGTRQQDVFEFGIKETVDGECYV